MAEAEFHHQHLTQVYAGCQLRFHVDVSQDIRHCRHCSCGVWYQLRAPWIDRDLDKLYSTSDRPLASNNDQLKTLYEQRRPLYRMYSDIIVENNGTVEDCIRTIMEKTGLKEKKL